MAEKELRPRANGADLHNRLDPAQAATVVGGPRTNRHQSQQPLRTGKPLPRFLSGHRNSAAKLNEAAPATPRLGSAKGGGSMPIRRTQLRAEPEERHFTSRRRGGGLRSFILLLLCVAAGLAYLQSQGRLNERELRSAARSLGVESWLQRAGLFAERPSNIVALSLAEAIEIERLLDQMAFAPGAIDGVIDQRSTTAIRNFQDLAGAVADGVPSRALLEELRVLAALQRKQPQS